MDRLRNFGFLVKDLQRLFAKAFEQKARHMDVTLAQCKVLAYLSRNEGTSQARLAEMTGVEPMSVVRILDRMERDGWIERRSHPTDRRARQLYLQEKAQPPLQQLWKMSDEVRALALAGFKAEERTLLIDFLERARANLLDARIDVAPVGKTRASPREASVKTPTKRRTPALAATPKNAGLSTRGVRPKSAKPLRAVR